MSTSANERDSAPTTLTSSPSAPVIDLREGPVTRVRVSRDNNPFAALAPAERMRLIIRVLCELVAYDELDAPTAADHRRTLRDTIAESSDSTRPTSITG